jgi:hypothetical protein
MDQKSYDTFKFTNRLEKARLERERRKNIEPKLTLPKWVTGEWGKVPCYQHSPSYGSSQHVPGFAGGSRAA